MARHKLALPTRLFSLPFRQAAVEVARSEADGIQIDARNELRYRELSATGLRELKHLLNESQIQVSSLVFPLRRPLYDRERLDQRVAALKETLEFAHKLQSRIVTARIGRIPQDVECTEYQTLIEVLNDIARHANHVGATLCVTPANDTAEALRALLDRVDAGPIGIDLDPAALVLAREPLQESVQCLYDRMLHVRARDAVWAMDGAGQEMAVGRGEVDWELLVALLDQVGYRGWITCDRTAGDDQAGDGQRAVQYLRRVMQGE